MLFNSTEFIIFFPIVVALYFLLPQRMRWFMLLIASYYFYMCWKAEYLVLILISTLIDYFVAIQMAKQNNLSKRKILLIVSLVVNLGLLFSFKYFNFFSASLRSIFNYYNIFYDVPSFNVLLPVGISFYTFQTLSYTIDVYRRKREPEKHLGIFALYVAFFPLLGGLILDFADLLTLGPIGLYTGMIVGGIIGWLISGIYGFSRNGRIILSLLAGIYCTIPGTFFVPLATMVAAMARFREKPAPPSDEQERKV